MGRFELMVLTVKGMKPLNCHAQVQVHPRPISDLFKCQDHFIRSCSNGSNTKDGPHSYYRGCAGCWRGHYSGHGDGVESSPEV